MLRIVNVCYPISTISTIRISTNFQVWAGMTVCGIRVCDAAVNCCILVVINRCVLVDRRLRCLQCAKAVNVTRLFVAASSVKLKPVVQIGYTLFVIFFIRSVVFLYMQVAL